MKIPEKTAGLAAPLPDKTGAGIKLNANESFYSLPNDVLDEIRAELGNMAFNRYPDPLSEELCAAAADYYGVSPAQTVAGCGSDELINVVETALLPSGGRVLICEPDFGMYRFYARLREAVCVSAPRIDGLPDIDALRRECREGDIILLSNPCNPTGKGVSRREILRLADSIPGLLVADEAYMDFWNQSTAGDTETRENLLVLRTASKAIGLAGLRLGFCITNVKLAGILRAAKSPYNVSLPTQVIGVKMYRRPELLRERTQAAVKLTKRLRDELNAEETCTNFVLLTPPDAKALYEALLEKGIAVRLLGGKIRITSGSPEENEAVVKAVKEVLK